jgi:hypothetical protein
VPVSKRAEVLGRLSRGQMLICGADVDLVHELIFDNSTRKGGLDCSVHEQARILHGATKV